jgi:hypothetical protein
MSPRAANDPTGLLSLFAGADPALAAFSARVLGLFAEDAVRAWCRLPGSPYEAPAGRPTLRMPGQARGLSLDFVLRHRETGSCYVTELKAWPAFERGRFAVLDDPGRVDRVIPHAREAMEALLRVALDPWSMSVTAEGKSVENVRGAILVWASVTPDGRRKTMERFGFADVLGLDQMVAELVEKRPPEWLEHVEARRRVCDDLFDVVTGTPRRPG